MAHPRPFVTRTKQVYFLIFVLQAALAAFTSVLQAAIADARHAKIASKRISLSHGRFQSRLHVALALPRSSPRIRQTKMPWSALSRCRISAASSRERDASI